MEPLKTTFDERLQEIEAYLDLLFVLEQKIHSGPPKIGDTPITAQQQKILYSSVYLQLYNLVEATATWCVGAVATATTNNAQWLPRDLSVKLRREWVRTTARTHTELNMENRLNAAVELCDQLLDARPILDWEVEKGGGGNWDDTALEAIAERIGVRLKVSPEVHKDIKRRASDDMRPLELVRHLRNKLAHGDLSFTECGENTTVADLRDLKDRAARYLREVIDHFQAFIDGHNFLIEERRPDAGRSS